MASLISKLVIVAAFVLLIVSAANPHLTPRTPASGPVLAGQAVPLAPILIAESPAGGSIINTTTPVISVVYSNVTGRIDAVYFFLDGMNLSSAGTFNQSVFALPLALELRNGPHLANVTVANVLGFANSTAWSFTVDTTPPILLLTSPAYPAVPTSAVLVEGTALLASAYFAAAAPITVTATVLPAGFRNSAVAAANGSFSVPVVLAEGGNVIFVNATDRIGNLAVEIVKILSDTLPPPLIVLTPANLSVSPTNLVRVSGLCEFGDFVTVNGYSVIVAPNGTWSVVLALPEGLNILEIAAADSVGNFNATGLVILVDSDAPQVVLSSPTYSLTDRSQVVVSGTATDTKLVAVLVNGEPVSFAANGSFSVTVTLPEGIDPIVVVAVDAAQHVTTVRTEVRVDTTPPVVRVSMPPDGLETNVSTVFVNGTVDDVKAMVLVNGQEVRPDATGHWQTTVALLPGANTVTVSAVDAAGNEAAPIVRHVTYFSPIPSLQNGTSSNEQSLASLDGLVRLSLVGIVLLFAGVTLVLYSRLSARIREDRRVIAELVRARRPKP